MTSNEQLMLIVMEECAELQQAISKALRFGVDGCNPETPHITNEYNINLEYQQLTAVMEMLVEKGIITEFDKSTNSMIKENKKEKVKYYQSISENLNLI